MGSTTIHPFPELVALAEEEARESYSAMRDAGIATPYDVHGRKRSEADPWDQLPTGTREWWISARMSLLCDLTRPASRDAVARLVANRLGWCADEVIAACERDWPKLRALWRSAGLPELPRWEPQPPAPEALAAVVRHLWPPEAPRG